MTPHEFEVSPTRNIPLKKVLRSPVCTEAPPLNTVTAPAASEPTPSPDKTWKNEILVMFFLLLSTEIGIVDEIALDSHCTME